MLSKKSIIILLFDTAAIVAVFVVMWLYGVFLPSWVTWNKADIHTDLNSDKAEETISLHHRRLEVSNADGTLFSSPASWRVSDVLAEDMDKDGNKEIVMTVWKRGKNGENSQISDEREKSGFSQHVFVYCYDGEKVSSAWESPDTFSEVTKSWFDEKGRLHLLDADEQETVWKWENRGLSNVEDPDAEDNAVTVPENETAAQPDVTVQKEENTQEAEPQITQIPVATEPPDNEVHTLTLLAVGDNIAHDALMDRAYDPEQGIFDFKPMFSEVKDWISSYDIAVINQETVFTDNPEIRSGYPLFVTPDTMGDAIVDAGFDVVTSATNHSYDNWEAGIEYSVHYWREHYPEIPFLGMYASDEVTVNDDGSISHPTMWTVEKNGIRMAMFNYTEWTNGLELEEGYLGNVCLLSDIDQLINDLHTAEETHDISICFIHIGEEYSTEPADYVRGCAAMLADAGADIIICSHPHVMQGCETITTENNSTALVYWSLGNFASNQHDFRTMPGGAASVVIEKQPGQKATVISHDLYAVMCHFTDTITKVYRLDQYTEELAAEHLVNNYYGATVFTFDMLYSKVYAIPGYLQE